MTFNLLSTLLFTILLSSCFTFCLINWEIYHSLENHDRKLKELEASYYSTLELNKNVIEANKFILRSNRIVTSQNQRLIELKQ